MQVPTTKAKKVQMSEIDQINWNLIVIQKSAVNKQNTEAQNKLYSK